MLPLAQQPFDRHCEGRSGLPLRGAPSVLAKRPTCGVLEGALGVPGYALATLEHLDRCACHAHIQLVPRVLARRRVVVAADLVVVVDAVPCHLSLGVIIAPRRQRSGRLVHLGEGAGVATGQLLDAPLTHVGQRRAHRPFQFGRLRCAGTPTAPAHEQQHAALGPWEDGRPPVAPSAVMLGKLVVGGLVSGSYREAFDTLLRRLSGT